MVKLKVTFKETGKTWTEDNQPHSWQELCLHIMKHHEEFHLLYCDIECLAKGRTTRINEDNSWSIEEQWYMLDEMGRYEPMPQEYVIEELYDNRTRDIQRPV